MRDRDDLSLRQLFAHNRLIALAMIACVLSGCTLTANDLEGAPQSAALADNPKPNNEAGLIPASDSALNTASLAVLSAVKDRSAANGLPAPYASPRRFAVASAPDGKSTDGKAGPAVGGGTTPAPPQTEAAVVTALVDPAKAVPSSTTDPAVIALSAAPAESVARQAPVSEPVKPEKAVKAVTRAVGSAEEFPDTGLPEADPNADELAEADDDSGKEAEARIAEEPAPPPVHIATIDEIIAKARADLGGGGARFFSRTLKTYATYAVASAHVDTSCFPSELKTIFRQIYREYGAKPEVSSGFRNVSYNRSVGGAHGSYHIRCEAADIKVPGVDKYELARFLRGLRDVGGVGVYSCKSIVHVDVGPRRDWNASCRSRRNQA